MPFETPYRHLNVGGTWPGATLTALATRSGGPVVELAAAADGGLKTQGLLVLAAPTVEGLRWNRVRVLLDEPRPAGTHVRVWTARAAAVPADPVPGTDTDADDAPVPTRPGRWRAAPVDALDVRVLGDGPDKDPLWLAVELMGDGTASPAVTGLRVDHVGPGWAAELPRAYVADSTGQDVVGRWLASLAAVGDGLADTASGVRRLLDPSATPSRPGDDWLATLAAWTGLETDLARLPSTDSARAVVAAAMDQHERRGTVLGIVASVAQEAGIAVTITEPILDTDPWLLGDGHGLGWDAALAPANPGPSTLGLAAVVDRSRLIEDEDTGRPLWDPTAHRFCVHVAATDLRDERRRGLLVEVLDREKPAHTRYEICPESPDTDPLDLDLPAEPFTLDPVVQAAGGLGHAALDGRPDPLDIDR